MNERRARKRIPIDRLALLSFDGVRGVYPGLVQNISASGACIAAPSDVPCDEFELSFDGFRRTLICRVAWRKEMLCGASFLSHRGLPASASDSIRTDQVIEQIFRQFVSGLEPHGVSAVKLSAVPAGPDMDGA
jgi:hypothetical protein